MYYSNILTKLYRLVCNMTSSLNSTIPIKNNKPDSFANPYSYVQNNHAKRRCLRPSRPVHRISYTTRGSV